MQEVFSGESGSGFGVAAEGGVWQKGGRMDRTYRRHRTVRRAAAVAAMVAVVAAAAAGCRSCGGTVRVRKEPAVAGTAAPEAGRELVVLLHGMRRTGRSMGKMAAALRREGYDTAVCDYPSCRGVHETASNVFAAVGPVSVGAPRVHFVTHSLGGILLRDAFRDGAVPPNLGRVVMLGPPNGGCEHVDRFGRLPFFGAVWGTPAPELGTGPDSYPNGLPPIAFDCGVVAGTDGGLLGRMLPGPNDGKVTVASAGAAGAKEVLELPVNHTWMMRDGRVIDATLRYLRGGTFGGK